MCLRFGVSVLLRVERDGKHKERVKCDVAQLVLSLQLQRQKLWRPLLEKKKKKLLGPPETLCRRLGGISLRVALERQESRLLFSLGAVMRAVKLSVHGRKVDQICRSIVCIMCEKAAAAEVFHQQGESETILFQEANMR